MSNKHVLSRRAVLRGALAGGALVTIPLPRLGAMLNSNGTAYAAGNAIQRFGLFFVGNGVVPSEFAPKPRITGPLGALTLQLSPFEKVKNKITVVSGYDLHTGRPDGVPHGHFAGALTGACATSDRRYQLPSIDQVIAKASLGKDTAYKSLEVGVCNATSGVSQNIYKAVSQSGTDQPNFPETSASTVFNRLFSKDIGGTTATPTSPTIDPLAEVEKSVLDAVRADAASLRNRLGAEDRFRLDQHLESIRALEKRITQTTSVGGGAVAACQKPAAAKDGNASGDGLDANLAKTMADLLVMALACDLTRVFTYQLTRPAAHVLYGVDNLGSDFHGTCHGKDEMKIQRGVKYALEFYASLLEKMDAVPEGDGTLLDNSTVLLSTCVAWGRTHTQYEWPCVIGGRGGRNTEGKFNLQGNWHHRSTPTGDNFSKVLLTLANINGANLESIGKDGGNTDTEAQGIRGPT